MTTTDGTRTNPDSAAISTPAAPTVDELADLRAHATRIAELEAQLAEQRQLRDAAIGTAARDGQPRSVIARAAGLSRETIHRMIRPTAGLMLAVLAVVGLAGCGDQDAASPATTVVVEQPAATPEPAAVAAPAPAPLGQTVPVAPDVSALVVAGSVAGAYGVQFTASAGLAGSWVADVAGFSGRTAAGDVVQVASSMWPENPTLSTSATVVGGTLVFAGDVVEIRYSTPDGSAVAWSVAE